jgi:hypothetical protein
MKAGRWLENAGPCKISIQGSGFVSVKCPKLEVQRCLSLSPWYSDLVVHEAIAHDFYGFNHFFVRLVYGQTSQSSQIVAS